MRERKRENKRKSKREREWIGRRGGSKDCEHEKTERERESV